MYLVLLWHARGIRDVVILLHVWHLHGQWGIFWHPVEKIWEGILETRIINWCRRHSLSIPSVYDRSFSEWWLLQKLKGQRYGRKDSNLILDLSGSQAVVEGVLLHMRKESKSF